MDAEVILLAAGAGIGALFSLWRSLVSLDRARHIEDVPTSKIRSAAQGYVELIGIAHPDQAPLKAPLTGKTCLWYDFCIERYTRTGKTHSWRTVRRGQSDHSFYLRDDTGECHLHPQGADILPKQRLRWYGNTERPMNYGGSGGSGILFGSGRYRYTERRISEGDPVYALGLFQTLQPQSPSEQGRVRMTDLITKWKKDHDSLLSRFDANGDGEIDMKEWEAARQQAANQARNYVLTNYDGEQVHVLAKPPGRRQHFIIACKRPLGLVRSYRLKGWGLLALSLVLAGCCAWVLLNPSQL
jgi:hypothetical protein